MSNDDKMNRDYIKSKVDSMIYTPEATERMKKYKITEAEMKEQLSDPKSVWRVANNNYIIKTKNQFRIALYITQSNQLCVNSIKSYRASRFILLAK